MKNPYLVEEELSVSSIDINAGYGGGGQTLKDLGIRSEGVMMTVGGRPSYCDPLQLKVGNNRPCNTSNSKVALKVLLMTGRLRLDFDGVFY